MFGGCCRSLTNIRRTTGLYPYRLRTVTYNRTLPFYIHRNLCNRERLSPSYTSISIGSVNVPLPREIEHPEFVPYLPHQWYSDALLQSQQALSHLQWMMQKDLIGQDMVLLGSPGFLRRRLAYKFCEMAEREYEYISLSRDSSESDLKQRREIVSKSGQFIDQCAVRAALYGRVLIVEGLEKADRNILPILNNLLENREMALEDGRFMMGHRNYDRLVHEKGYTKEQLKHLNIVRVHPKFRVVALTLSAPKYEGNPLDPPLRSRFQARYVGDLPTGDHYSLVATALDRTVRMTGTPTPDVVKGKLHVAIRLASVIGSMETIGKDSYSDLLNCPPEFPSRSLMSLTSILEIFPKIDLTSVIPNIYPYKFMNIRNFLKFKSTLQSTLNILKEIKEDLIYDKFDIFSEPDGTKVATFNSTKGDVVTTNVPHGPLRPAQECDDHKFVWTQHTNCLLTSMMISHASGSDLCLIGKKGSGKSEIIRKFAKILGYEIETQLLYKDINYRDLLQRRVTLPNGDTTWVHSNLIMAALRGSLAVLDNIHRLQKNSLSSLNTLIVDRQVILPDGTRLVHWDHYTKLREKFSEKQLTEKKIFSVHRNFRIIAVGDFPTEKSDYITLETAGLFNFHEILSLTLKEIQFLEKLIPGILPEISQKILIFSEFYNSDPEFKDYPFTLRQILRCARMADYFVKHGISKFGNLHKIIHQSVLSEFLPKKSKSILESILKRSEIIPEKEKKRDSVLGPSVGQGRGPIEAHLVPKIEFFENQRHNTILEEMNLSFQMGEHLLLIGNQGTGKNKIADRFLEVCHLPRQYIQLHRDTTVASLTSQPSIVDGCIVWEDSPLVKAVRDGHILIIDEADKAEIEVVTILKNLIDGEMVLADNRRILSEHRQQFYRSGVSDIIPINKFFRLIVLANRPGYPFLGNNFFRECGELFSIHAVDNPDPASEIELLQFYAPNVPRERLQQLTSAFHILREKHNEGLLSYPYSTRETVNIAKHMEKFPSDRLPDILGNVFAYDLFNPQALYHIVEAFKNQGINLKTHFSDTLRQKMSENTSGPLALHYHRDEHQFSKSGKASEPKHGKVDPNNTPHVGGNTWAGGTGGRDTAGLGGKGGPYRLDAGHDVYQISDEEKKDIDESVLKKAREMAEEGLRKRLQEINMSPYDAKLYEKYYQAVKREIAQIRVILEGLDSKKNQRQWLKYQTTGDLDESRLVEGVTGEKTIYKRRTTPQKNTNNFGETEKPKKVYFVMDVSASMYRFDGQDNRLQRMLESTVMIMEGFQGAEQKIEYAMVGHSGDSCNLPLIEFGKAPQDRNVRLSILQQMVAYAQYSWPGDNTLEATSQAITKISTEETDQSYVFVLSDANFDRYRISPKDFGRILSEKPEVQTCAIFIASLWEGQAQRISGELPPGKSFLCLDTSELPSLFQKLLTESVLRD